MLAIKAQFDGEKVVLPPDLKGVQPGSVIVIFENGTTPHAHAESWTKASEEAFTRVWDSDEDAIYDKL